MRWTNEIYICTHNTHNRYLLIKILERVLLRWLETLQLPTGCPGLLWTPSSILKQACTPSSILKPALRECHGELQGLQPSWDHPLQDLRRVLVRSSGMGRMLKGSSLSLSFWGDEDDRCFMPLARHRCRIFQNLGQHTRHQCYRDILNVHARVDLEEAMRCSKCQG